MTREEVDLFEKTQGQLQELYSEVSLLSKKSQNDPLNKFKLRWVNQILALANNLIGDENKPFLDFSQFDEVDMPTNSDVGLILSQYLSCLERFRSENIYHENMGRWYWLIDNEKSYISTPSPDKLKKR